jgi:hypothetical protein
VVLAFQLPVIDAAGGAQPSGNPARPAASPSRIYKWVDDRGVTHYGQSIPSEFRNQEAAVMNKRGLTVGEIESAATPEQRKALEERAAQQKEEQKRLVEQRRRDRALINTYSSAKEIDQARERNLLFAQQALRGLDPRIRGTQERLTNLRAQAETHQQSGRVVPDWLTEDIARQEEMLAALHADSQRHKANIESIQARFDADKKRYIELTEMRSR